MRLSCLALLAAALAVASPAHALDTFDYRTADSVALAAPDDARSVAELTERVTAGLATDRERARAIYTWITTRVAYDARAFFSKMVPRQDPQSVIRRKTAVCEGFSALYLAMGRAAGLEVVEVVGVAKAGTGDLRNPVALQEHAWNAVRVDGAWRPLDASWGAGDLVDRRFVRRFRDFYFFPDPAKLIYSHRANDARLQGLGEPVGMDEFRRMPVLQRDFWELGFSPAAVRAAGAAGDGFAGVFPVRDRPVMADEAPVSLRLAPGSAHRFRLRAPGATEVVAVSGTAWQPLAPDAEGFAGEATVSGPDLVILVRYADLPAGAVVLRYETVQPRGRRR